MWGKQPFRLLATFRQFSQETVTLGARRKDVKNNKPLYSNSRALLGSKRYTHTVSLQRGDMRPAHLQALSIFRMIRSAHWTADATIASVRGLERLSNRSSVVLRCRATRMPAIIPNTRLRPSSISAPKDAQSHLGHESIVTTMDVYAQEIPQSVKRMVQRDEEDIFAAMKTSAARS